MAVWISILLFFNTIVGAPTSTEPPQLAVYVFLLEDCMICQNYIALLNDLAKTYEGEVTFIGYFPNKRSDYKNIAHFKEKYNIQFPLKTDHYKKNATKFGITVTPEVVLYNTETATVLYRGSIDDGFVRIGKRKQVVAANYLADALKAAIENPTKTHPNNQAVGCFINFNE